MIKIPKGTKDVLPEESYKWHYVEEQIREITALYNAKEIRTPTFEHTELFLRGVGETTDVVNKEMYTFLDKGERSITLKAEGTAGCVRSFIENNLSQSLPLRAYYITPVFRYERPQAGRLREHHQFGVEYFGLYTPEADAEVISIAKTLFNRLGLNPKLYINSIGCSECRKDYHKALTEYLSDNEDKLCPTCQERLKKNPLRVLDCKVPTCKELLQNAPSVLDYLCDDCKAHHEGLKHTLTLLGIDYQENPKIVRGLDYYTRTVFEFVSEGLGSQDTVCGGGRYNNLVESLGGKPCPAVGFGMGIERLLLTVEAMGNYIPNTESVDVYVCNAGQKDYSLTLVNKLRNIGVSALTEYGEKSIKAQMKYADKIGAHFTLVIGDREVENNQVTVKDMLNGTSEDIQLDNIIEYFKRR